PLLRARLFRLGEHRHVLLLVMHAAASDCASMRLLARELMALLAGRSLPPVPFQFADFAAWQHERLERAPELLEAWRERLADDPPPLALPPDRPRTAVRKFRCASLRAGLPADLWGALQALAQREQATPFMVLAAGFLLLLSRTGGRSDLVLGVPVPGRVLPEVEDVVGPFGNTLPLRIQVEQAEPVRGFLARVREAWLDALSGQEVPAARLLDVLPLKRDPCFPRLFQTSLTLLDPERPLPGPPGFEISSEPFHGGHAHVELALTFREAGGGLEGSLDYDPDLFDQTTPVRFLDRLARLYRGMAEAPDTPVGCLPRLDDRESRELEGMASTRPGQEGLLHVLVAQQAARNPEAVAFEEPDRRLTYGALDRDADRLAHALL
ncbi:MAG TPA: condensation domain-containing protein, partial [Holophaga sp.]|nr:condensation domain-containing protein [Holophaga sp.]